jgi:hypothetical protein
MPVATNIDTSALLAQEIETINRLFRSHQVQAMAHVRRTMCVRSSFIAYGLRLAPGEQIKRVEAVLRELSNDLTMQRMRAGIGGQCLVRLRDYPIALEVPFPNPTPLDWRKARLHIPAMQALVGQSYPFTGAQAEYIDLDRHYHILVAAQSGGGKSTLMRMALATLALNTPPSALRLVLVDLKADDLVPFAGLPHVERLATSVDQAAAAIAAVHELRDARIAGAPKSYRLLLVIDELAELGEHKDVLLQLGRILSTGRSLRINVWAGTQYPTAATIGSVVSKSFTVRFVGRVVGAQAAQVATQRPGTGAHLLAYPGDFVRVDGPELVRLKAYNLPADTTDSLVAAVRDRWGDSHQPRLTVDSDSDKPATVPAPAPAADDAGDIADRIRPLWEQGASLAAMIRAAYGPTANTGGSNRLNVLKALERLQAEPAAQSEAPIIRMRA